MTLENVRGAVKTLRAAKLLCLSILSFCIVSCASTSPSPQARQECILGEEALYQGKYSEAIDRFTAYLSKVPKDADAHLKLGRALLKNEQLDEAIPQFKEALNLKPGDEQSKLVIKNSIFDEGAKFFDQKKYDVAIRYLISHLTINADDIDTHIRLTKYFLEMGDQRNAMGSVRRAASLDPKNPEVIELLDYFSRGFH
jgi:tetratricopeptide (TPR) repeat protein